MSKDHPIGLEAWEARRKEWTTPPQDFDFKTIQRYQEAFEELGDSEKKVGIYKQLVQQLQTFTQPVPLKFIVPILIAGWQEDGTWPKGMVVRCNSD
ncbi:hypothetical protein G6F56_009979 [Rhizopus delemar]|uniref:Gag1-like clamp domain-containing protein n=1 Tax=Rhizopus stolonifer TaxID=4846 RepID=A0A367K087_RHIST|nr:hypothetical protein G6F56_009979 [Rhizopus delemar]RCH95559.1 hypothetical protein CU098_009895 [Rhizopus stolonifer]